MCSEAHIAAARQVADEGIVLLKNDHSVLPLQDNKNILVVGENAIKQMTVGGGSSSLKAKYEISPLQGITARNHGMTTYQRGYIGDVGGEYNGVTTGQDLTDSRSAEQLTRDAVEAAKQADIVIFVGGLNKSDHQDAESYDRLSYELPYNQGALIEQLAKANPNTIVVIISGNAYSTPWLTKVPALMQAWFSGSETGHAIADVIFGDVNPSGKLPFTFMQELSDYPAHQYGESAYPGINDYVEYKDDIFVGYRYADLYGRKKDLKYTQEGKQYTIHAPKHRAVFPFGYGLSYTTFQYGKATLNGNTVSVDVTNTSAVDGKEVVQLYVADRKSTLVRPKKELKGFTKVALKAGETKTVQFTITDDMLSYFDPDAHQWVVEPGVFDILIGSSSADIKTSVPYNR